MDNPTLKCDGCKAFYALVIKIYPDKLLPEQGLENLLEDACTLLDRSVMFDVVWLLDIRVFHDLIQINFPGDLHTAGT